MVFLTWQTNIFFKPHKGLAIFIKPVSIKTAYGVFLTCLISWFEAIMISFIAGGGIFKPSLNAIDIIAAWWSQKKLHMYSIKRATTLETKLTISGLEVTFST